MRLNQKCYSIPSQTKKGISNESDRLHYLKYSTIKEYDFLFKQQFDQKGKVAINRII